jgi:hypothetical protein
MEGMSHTLLIAISETKANLADKKFERVDDLLRAAMKATRNHWLVTTEDERFRAAVGAAMLLASDTDKERIRREIETLKRFSAAMVAAQQGVVVDFASVLPLEEPKDVIGLMNLWRETA